MVTRVSKITYSTIVSLIFLLNLGCEKKEENENPTLRFLQPDSNIVIDKDTLISFVVEPFDKDGTIDKVEFLLNDTIVKIISKPPYYYDWNIETEKNIGNNYLKAIAYDNHGAKGEVGIMIEIKSYLSKWVGVYGGTSYHWRKVSYPLINNESFKKVSVDVSIGEQDSCLKFIITYNDTIIGTNVNLLFSNLGVHFSQWGIGSGYGFLKINFKSDSLYYYNFQKCGMPCSSGVDFNIEKDK